MGNALTRTALELWFHQELGDISQRRMRNHSDDLSVVNAPLPRTEALRIRARFTQALLAAGLGVEDIDSLANDRAASHKFAEVLDQVLRETPGYEPIDTGNNARRPTGLNHAITQLSALGREGCRPISPFDPRWSNTHAMQEAGSHLRYTHGVSILDPATSEREQTVWSDPVAAARGDERWAEDVLLLDHEDEMGISAMRPWLTEADLAVARKVLLADGLQPRRPEAIRRSIELLKELRNTGEEFELTPERNGQLSIRLTERNLMVRLAEPANGAGHSSREPYLGRVYGNGLVWRFSSTGPEGRSGQTPQYVPEIDEVVLPLRAAMGKPLGTMILSGHADARGNTMLKLRPDLFLRSGTSNSSASRAFGPVFDSPDAAEAFVANTIDSARHNFSAALDMDLLVEAYTRAKADGSLDEIDPETGEQPEVEFTWSSDPAIANFQQQCMYNLIAGTSEHDVRQLAEASLDEVIGTPQPRIENDARRWFDPDMVSRWSSGEESPLSTLRALNAALRATPDLTPAEVLPMLQGDERRAMSFCDDLLGYDARQARGFGQLDQGGVQYAALETVHEVLADQGLVSIEAAIDPNGVIHWSGQRYDSKGNLQAGYVTGRLGQVFEPDAYGAIATRFAGGNNNLVVPGYRAVVLPQDAEAGEQTIEQRTQLHGYREEMLQRIRQQLVSDVVAPTDQMMGATTSLNGVYRTLFDVRYPIDHLERAQAEGSRELAEAVLRTQAGRVRYPEWISDTMYQAWALENGKGSWMADAVGWTELEATGYRNRTVLSRESDGYFDPMMTTDSAPGVSRFLVEGTKVDAEGHIVPGELYARAPVANLPGLEFCNFDAFDRQRMTLMNLLTASRVTEPVMAAQVPLAGWTMEDGIVVSGEFAARQHILDADGTLRPLQIGDKISDLHGNKGVVAQVIDRWRFVDGTDPLLDEATRLFQDNPRLDVVMSPFGALSRFNAGIPREAEAAGTAPLLGTAGLPLPSEGEMGALRMIVTNKSVTAGTRIYAEADELEGFEDDREAGEPMTTPSAPKSFSSQGRRVSGQLAWALQAQGCDAVMGELYRHNTTAIEDLREYAGLVGVGVDDTGRLQPQRTEVAERRVLDIEPLLDAKGRLQRKLTRDLFSETIATAGGDLLVPFDLDLPSRGDVDFPERRGLEAGPREGTWRLPVLSSHLRKPVPGATNKGHEYSGIYERIFMAASEYRLIAETDPVRAIQLKERAQRELNALTGKVIQREFEGRHNIFRDSVMAARQSRSATAVWTADPRLDLDQIGLSPAMATQLGVVVDSHLLVWRDPVLRGAGVRYLRVSLDENLQGVSINPLLTKTFDGDFDGDSVGLVALPQPEPGEPATGGMYRAHNEAMRRLTVEANLIDRGSLEFSEELGYEVHPLSVHTGSDVAAARTDLAQFVGRANDLDADLFEARGAHRRDELLEQGRELVAEMSTAVRESLVGMSQQYGLRYSDVREHLESIRRTCIETGAKGSEGALTGYSRYLGIHPSGEDLGQACPEGGVRTAAQGVNVALVVKKAVGIPGRISQRGVTAMRNADLEAALELTYPCTQSIMQCKHDPTSALHKYALMQTTARDLWRGYRMDPEQGYTVITDEKGVPEQATREEWVSQALALYRDPMGLNIGSIDPQLVERASRALCDDTGHMINAEQCSALDPWTTAPEAPAHSTALDRLSYAPGFDALLIECQAGSRLFDGRQATFAPGPVKRNLDLEQREAGQETLFEGIADAPGPHDRKRDLFDPPVQKRTEVTVVHQGNGVERPIRVGRRDVLADGVEGFKPSAGNRRLGAARPAARVGAKTGPTEPEPEEVEGGFELS